MLIDSELSKFVKQSGIVPKGTFEKLLHPAVFSLSFNAFSSAVLVSNIIRW